MKIIQTDNFDRDTVSENLVAENVQEYYAQTMCDALIAKFSGDDAQDYFRVVPDNHVLYKWEP